MAMRKPNKGIVGIVYNDGSTTLQTSVPADNIEIELILSRYFFFLFYELLTTIIFQVNV